jgi:FKBP-type peptidyl-prolyl cis-trans isomerase
LKLKKTEHCAGSFQYTQAMKKTLWFFTLVSVLTLALWGQGAKVNTTKSGLKYIDHKVGEGAEAVAGTMVEVHYTGWLYVDGKRTTKFDSSVDSGRPFSFPLGAGRVIKGWDEGVAGMKIGGKRELIIPPNLGYGSSGAGGVIPPNATLNFDVELLKVTK